MSRRVVILLAVGGMAFAAVTTLVGSASGAPVDFLVLDLVTGSSFFGAGLVAARLRPSSPAGPALLLSGVLWFVGSYGPSSQPIVSPLGFAFERWYDVVLAALLLALSSGAQRLGPRGLVVLLVGASALRTAGRLFLVDPVRTYGCAECTANPFAVSTDPAVFETVEIAANSAIAVLAAVVGAIVVLRLVRAGPVLRRIRWPILIAGILAMAAATFDAAEYAWSTATGTVFIEVGEPFDLVFNWAFFLARVLVPLAILLATLRLRAAPGPLGPFAAGLERTSRSGTTGSALRVALGDSSLQLLHRGADGTWRSETGSAVDFPADGDGRAITIVGPADRPLAAVIHDPALGDQPELVQAVIRVLRLALENERLEGELREQLRAVTESRARIVTAAEDERRRLERDLHDGAQQRLIGVTLALQQARGSAEAVGAPDALRGHLEAAAEETREAIRELRELARGIHPAILADEGLSAAVTALARRAGITVNIRVDITGRLPSLVESTAYFTVAEALTNTQRHARATRASVRLALAGGALQVEVDDNGQGGAEPERGSGLRGLADRVQAVGGRLDIESDRHAGTRVRATIPVR
ncbi:MAG: histidine kinase [Chloroflexota bacterium]